MRAGNIFSLLKSRVALNIYFWLGVLLFQVDNINHRQHYQFGYYLLFIIVNLLLLVLLLYTNNLWLIPRFLARKKRKIYVAISVPFTFLIALLYTAVQKQVVQHFPAIDIYQISLITTPVSAKWDADTWLYEVPVFFFAFLLLVFVFTALWFWHDNAKQKKRAEQLAKKQTETELAFLRNQLNPHFLFNTLNNLYGLSIAKSDAAPEVILKLSGLLRYMLYQSNAELISFQKEKEAMQA